MITTRKNSRNTGEARTASVANPTAVATLVIDMARWVLPALALFWAWSAHGQAAYDPTHPPPGWLAAQPNAQGVVPKKTGEAAASQELQMIVSGKTRRYAVIDGEVVKTGDMVNGSRVVRIDADEVVMQDPAKSLKMAPAAVVRVSSSSQTKKPEEKR